MRLDGRSYIKLVQLTALLLLLIPEMVFSRELESEVVYVTTEAVFINSGSSSGVKKGDVGEIHRNGEILATIEVVYVAEKSSSCKFINRQLKIVVGDKAIINVDELLENEVPEKLIIADATSGDNSGIKSKTVAVVDSKDKKVSRIRGKIGIQYYVQNDLEEKNYDYSMPSLSGSIRADHLLSSDLSLNIRFRARRYYREYETSYSKSDWNNRIYEVSISHLNPKNHFSYSFGRVLSREISGIGTLDGGVIEYTLNSKVKSGAFAGGQPDLENTSPQFNETKAGIFFAFNNEILESLHSSATVALAGKYNSGEISKEFFYEQLNLNYGGVWGIYQSSEIGLNRGWRLEKEGTSLSVSNVLVNLRYTPSRKILAYAGYDTRKLVRTWETKETPDSLFDDSYREGFRAGVSFRLPKKIYAGIRGGLRKSGENNNTNTYSFTLGKHNLLDSGIRVEVASNFYNNSFSNGYQPSFRIDRSIFGKYHAAIQVGQNNYELASIQGATTTNNWLKISMDGRVTKRIYTSVYAEFYRGDSYDSNIFMIETGYRF